MSTEQISPGFAVIPNQSSSTGKVQKESDNWVGIAEDLSRSYSQQIAQATCWDLVHDKCQYRKWRKPKYFKSDCLLHLVYEKSKSSELPLSVAIFFFMINKSYSRGGEVKRPAGGQKSPCLTINTSRTYVLQSALWPSPQYIFITAVRPAKASCLFLHVNIKDRSSVSKQKELITKKLDIFNLYCMCESCC